MSALNHSTESDLSLGDAVVVTTSIRRAGTRGVLVYLNGHGWRTEEDAALWRTWVASRRRNTPCEAPSEVAVRVERGEGRYGAPLSPRFLMPSVGRVTRVGR